MWSVGLLCVVAVLTICITHWIYKWRNPKCNGALPPGSMGIPVIGETLQLIIPSYSLELPPFLKHRLKRMWSVGLLCVVAVLTICITHWIYKWRNPKCNGALPPGSMGIPVIGETLQLIIPSYSLELPPFLKHRLKRMWSVGLLCVVAVLTICITHWIYKWRNPKCNGVLPPGSMGIPVIGETLQLIIPSYSLELPPFLKHRLKRYGTIFRTNVAGRAVIVSADPEFNYFLLQQDGKLVESWALDTYAKVFAQDSRFDRPDVQKYVRNLVLNHFGAEAIREKLLPQFDEMVRETLSAWSRQDSIEMKSAAAKMTLDFGAKQLFSYDPEESHVNLSDLFRNFAQGLMSLPLNIPGTAHHRCLTIHKKVSEMMRYELRRRLMSTERHQGDLLDHFIQDMNTKKFLTEDFIVQHMFNFLYIIFDSISTTIALSLKLLAEHPSVLEELTAEHEAILKNRENSDSPITWEDYKSMTFTLQVIHETLRLANIAPGMFRKALKDIEVKGYTIPKGWVIILATSALHLNSDNFENPLEFNPRRWKDLESSVAAKNFMPFGSGLKQCAGSEYSRVIIATFLHVLVTKYRWTKINGCEIMRSPIIRLPNGFHFKVSKKNN